MADLIERPDNRAVQVPLIERLRRAPKDKASDVPFQWDEDGRETGHHHIPWGYMLHEAADALEAKERDIIATRTALLLANERGLTGVAIAKDAPLNYLLDIPNHIGKENERLWAKVELLAATVTRIANIAARLAEIARSVHIGDLERAEISALELELVKEKP